MERESQVRLIFSWRFVKSLCTHATLLLYFRMNCRELSMFLACCRRLVDLCSPELRYAHRRITHANMVLVYISLIIEEVNFYSRINRYAHLDFINQSCRCGLTIPPVIQFYSLGCFSVLTPGYISPWAGSVASCHQWAVRERHVSPMGWGSEKLTPNYSEEVLFAVSVLGSSQI